MNSLQNRVVVVTGASGGMGQDFCRRLVAEGARLAICGRNGDKLRALTQELPEDTLSSIVDVAAEEQVMDFFQQIRETFGGADALVNLAGLSIPGKITETDEISYDMMLDTNVKGVFLCSKHFVPLAHAHAQIINVVSDVLLFVLTAAPHVVFSQINMESFKAMG